MARRIGPKHKISRREGVNPTGTSSRSLERRLHVPPGGTRFTRRASDYAQRLRAKQRVKREYGMTESQFGSAFEEASRTTGRTGENLLVLLERRLDNVIYRLGFANTRPMARQTVVHAHVQVNSVAANVPSYKVKPGDVITLDAAMMKELDTKGAAIPPWLSVEGNVGRVLSNPRREDLDPSIRESLIVEFYAR